MNDTESPLDDLVVVATKPNTPLANELNVVVGGSGANRTVQVFHTVPLSNNFGTVTIQLTLKDTQCTDPNDLRNPCPSGSTTTSFTVSVFRYAMLGVTNVPPAVVALVQRGKNISLEWKCTEGATTTVVDSPTVVHQVVVVGPPGQTPRTYNSGFQYKSNTKSWVFTLTTKDGNRPFPTGAFTVTIRSTTPLGYSPKTFALQVVP